MGEDVIKEKDGLKNEIMKENGEKEGWKKKKVGKVNKRVKGKVKNERNEEK